MKQRAGGQAGDFVHYVPMLTSVFWVARRELSSFECPTAADGRNVVLLFSTIQGYLHYKYRLLLCISTDVQHIFSMYMSPRVQMGTRLQVCTLQGPGV